LTLFQSSLPTRLWPLSSPELLRRLQTLSEQAADHAHDITTAVHNFVFNADFGKTTALNHQDVLAFDQNVFGVQQAADHAHDITTAVQQVLDHAHDTTAGVVIAPDATHHVADLHAQSFHFV
jgi:hypothetical protein